MAILLPPVAFLLLSSCAVRPPAPPDGAEVGPPWGAIDLHATGEGNLILEQSLRHAVESEPPGRFDQDGDGIREYSLLLLSGGGSNGAFGAGYLSGWTQAGTRPDFKIVTGVSTGALQATLAFLGPRYDSVLKEVYTLLETKDVYRRKWPLAVIGSDSIYDNKPLWSLIQKHIDAEKLKAVADRYSRGFRLYVGTTNLDTFEFVVWDMGRIPEASTWSRCQHPPLG